MTDYNKIITTVNSITPDYQFIPDLNNTIVIDTSENRIGINTITPDENIHVSGGTIKTQDLIVLGELTSDGAVIINDNLDVNGNLSVKGDATYISSTNVDISDNIIRMNANHSLVNDGGIAVKNSSNVDKLFTYNNPGDYWTTHDTSLNLGSKGGVVSSGFMNIDKINIDGNTIDVSTGDLLLNSDTGQVVVEQVTFNSNTISTTGSLDLNLTAAGGDIFTQNTNLDLGTGVLTVNGVVNAHVPTGAIILWYGNSGNVPTGWAICDGANGTPNLQGKFVVCSGSSQNSYAVDATGGQNFPTLTVEQIPQHVHGTNCTQTDVNHQHPIIGQLGQTNVNHEHSIIGQLGNTNINHAHQVIVDTSSTSVTNVQNVSNNQTHKHQFVVPSHNHQGSNINFKYTVGDDQGENLVSILCDGENTGTTALSSVGGNVSIANDGGHNGETGNNQQSHTHTALTDTVTQTTTEIDIQNAGGNHRHPLGNISTEQTSSPSINHRHPLGNINTEQTSINHNHQIQIQQAGGGQTFDNRPEYYSLWYIMKL